MATLTIDFTVPTPTPVNGFTVKYRKIGTTSYSTLFPNPVSSPIIITVPDGESFEGTIKSDCGNTSTSPETNFKAYASFQIYVGLGLSSTTVCTTAPAPSYISNSYEDIYTGVSVYKNPELTILRTEPTHILNSFGEIFNITNGVVGLSTNTVCGSSSQT